MPRPDFNRTRAGGTRSKNPFAAWAARRKEAKQAAAEESAQKITNDTARNEATIVETLASIDFLHSKLPKSALEKKRYPDRPCGDLEYVSRAVRDTLIKSPQTLSVDLRGIDEKLYTLVTLFKQAVEQGDETAAWAAKAGIARGFTEIRNKVPVNQPELSKLFVESNVKYLDSWVTLVSMAQVVDRMKQNYAEKKASYEKARKKNENAIDELEAKINSDQLYAEAYQSIKNHDSAEDRRNWTALQREVFTTMVDRRMDRANVNLLKTIVTQSEHELAIRRGQVELLSSKVSSLSITTDPDLMNKYNEQIDELFQEMATRDAEIDESLKFLDEIDGRIDQLNNAPGAVRAREVAAEEAELAIQEINQRAMERKLRQETTRKSTLRELGLYSEEELDALQQQLAEEEAKESQLIMEQIQETEGEYNYN